MFDIYRTSLSDRLVIVRTFPVEVPGDQEGYGRLVINDAEVWVNELAFVSYSVLDALDFPELIFVFPDVQGVRVLVLAWSRSS